MEKVKKLLTTIWNKTKITKKNNLTKIEWLIANVDTINLYKPKYRNLYLKFIEEDVSRYIETIKQINNTDILNEYVYTKDVNVNTSKEVSISIWYTNNMEMLDNSLLLEFLLVSKELITSIDKCSSITNNSTTSINTRRLKPYYTNILLITDVIHREEYNTM